MVRTVAVVGAGFAGLVTARTLRDVGFEVTVFDKDAEVGGVWAASRRYPGLTTQNVRSTYAYSDFPYPRDYPEWPSGEQVQAYLDAYVDHAGLRDVLRLRTTVTSARQDPGTGTWTLTTSPGGAQQFDQLVVCNGIYSDTFVPDYPGAERFRQAGGSILHTTDFHDAADATGKHVLVVGYGKSSCDVATAVAPLAASTTVVARHLVWKIPRKFRNVLNFKMLLLTRMGEALFPYAERRGMEKFLHGSGKPVRDGMLGTVQSVVVKQFDLDRLNLHPGRPLETIVRGTVSLETPGFFDQVRDGVVTVERDTTIERLEAGKAFLSNGKAVPADLIVCGTGFHQRVPFLDEEVQRAVTDADGNFRLYRHMLPVHVRNLAFNGYNSSFFSQLNAEVGALWLAAYLTGLHTPPPAAEQDRLVDERLTWTMSRTDTNASHGTNIVPFSMHNVDEILRDLDLQIGAWTRFTQWLLPVDPRAYAGLRGKLLARAGRPA